MTADTFAIEAGNLNQQQAANLASRLLQFVTQQPGHVWATKTAAETWGDCCDKFAAEMVSDGVVEYIRSKGPDA